LNTVDPSYKAPPSTKGNPLYQTKFQKQWNNKILLNCPHLEDYFLCKKGGLKGSWSFFSDIFKREPIFLLLAPHTFSVIIHKNLTNVCTHDIAMHFMSWNDWYTDDRSNWGFFSKHISHWDIDNSLLQNKFGQNL
jgi:hypothetical protein